MGYIYLIRNGDLFKIGRTDDPKRRMKELKPDEVIAIHQTDDADSLEKTLHKRFKSKRLPQSEYFRINGDEALRALQGSGAPSYQSRLLSVNKGDKDYVPFAERVKRKMLEVLFTGSFCALGLTVYWFIFTH